MTDENVALENTANPPEHPIDWDDVGGECLMEYGEITDFLAPYFGNLPHPRDIRRGICTREQVSEMLTSNVNGQKAFQRAIVKKMNERSVDIEAIIKRTNDEYGEPIVTKEDVFCFFSLQPYNCMEIMLLFEGRELIFEDFDLLVEFAESRLGR